MRWPRSDGMDHHGVGVHTRADQALDLGAAEHLGQHRPIGADQDQPVRRMLLDPQPAVAVHGVGNVDQQGGRHRVAAVGQQGVHHLLGVVTGRPSVPQAERGQPVGMDVLRRPFQLGERGDRRSGRHRGWMVDLQQQRAVGLDDQGPRPPDDTGSTLLAQSLSSLRYADRIYLVVGSAPGAGGRLVPCTVGSTVGGGALGLGGGRGRRRGGCGGRRRRAGRRLRRWPGDQQRGGACCSGCPHHRSP